MWISHKKYSEELHRAFNDGVSEQKRKENLYERQNEELRKLISSLEATIADGKRELEKLRKTVREQSEADMVLAAIKVIVKAATEKPKDVVSEEHKKMEMARAQAQGVQQSVSSLYGLGLGLFSERSPFRY